MTTTGQVFEGFDIIIYCTGFHSPFEFFNQVEVYDENQQRFQPDQDKFQSLYGIFADGGLPNMFSILGPGGFLVHVSSTEIIEFQTEYIAQLIKFCLDNGYKKVKPNSDSCKEYSKLLTERGEKSIFSQCSSWYNENGKQVYCFSGKLSEYISILRTEKFSKLDFFNKDGQVTKVEDGGDYRVSDQFVPPFSAAKVSVFSRL